MAFNGYYNNGMNGYQQPTYNNGAVPDQLTQYRAQYQQPMPQAQQQYAIQSPNVQQPISPQMSGNGVIWVQGEAGAKAYMVAPGNSVMLMDSENPVVYLKSVDMSGMPSMRIFDLKERVPYVKEPSAMPSFPTESVEYITRAEFNKLEDKLNTLLEKENGQDGTAKSAESNKLNNRSKEEKRNG